MQPSPLSSNAYHMVTKSTTSSLLSKKIFNATLMIVSTNVKPLTWKQAFQILEGRASMEYEFDAFVRNKKWVKVSFKKGISNWKEVNVKQKNAIMSTDKHKSQVVTKSYHQIAWVDFDETSNPIVKHTAIRVVLFIALFKVWILKQLYVNNVFSMGT